MAYSTYILFSLILTVAFVTYTTFSHFSEALDTKAEYVFHQAFIDFRDTGVFDPRYNSLLPEDYTIVQSGNCLELKKKTTVKEKLCT